MLILVSFPTNVSAVFESLASFGIAAKKVNMYQKDGVYHIHPPLWIAIGAYDKCYKCCDPIKQDKQKNCTTPPFVDISSAHSCILMFGSYVKKKQE